MVDCFEQTHYSIHIPSLTQMDGQIPQESSDTIEAESIIYHNTMYILN